MRKLLLYISILVGFSSCSELTIRVDDIPENTPKGADMFICGNFNYWDPADENYRLKLGADSAWYVNIPAGMGELKFFITRGDWKSLETDGCGNRIPERSVFLSQQDTLYTDVQSWLDVEPLKCGLVTIVIDSLPEGATDSDEIILAGDFNGWNTEDTTYKARWDERTGKYMVSIPRPMEKIEYRYVITKGDMKSSDDNFGQLRAPKELDFTKDDTIKVSVTNWESEAPELENMFSIILDEVPNYTPIYEDIYVASNLNNWTPGDDRWKMNLREDGTYVLRVPKTDSRMEFKFTRGDWKSVEGDRGGGETSDRSLNLNNGNQKRFQVDSWKDLHGLAKGSLTLTVHVPESTPEDASLFAVGDFNGWDPGDFSYALKMLNDSTYQIKFPADFAGSGFKITRGSWSTSESDLKGRSTKNRKLQPGGSGKLEININAWTDKIWARADDIVFILRELPRKTPEAGPFYMSSNINGWKLSDKNYRFYKNENGEWELKLSKPVGESRMEFKINRGSWNNVETERFGGERYNRMYEFSVGDTVFIDVKGWKDI